MQSETSTPPATQSTARRRVRGLPLWLWRVLETLAWTALLLFACALLALRYWVLPNIEEHREVIIGAFSRGLGLPVRVGGIEADWQGLNPRVNLIDVRVYDREGREALVLPAVHNVVSWRSVLSLQLRMRSLIIDGPRLAVRRDAAGRLYVAGLELTAATEGERGGSAAEWILGQREIQVRNAEIEWVDVQRGAPPLKLSALNLRLRNAGGVHALGLNARPPEGFGSALVVRAELSGGTVTVPSKWSGRLYAEFSGTDLSAWQPWVDYPFELSRGRGALRMWVALGAGQRARTTLDLQLSEVSARVAPTLPRLELSSLAGRLEGRAEGGSFELNARELALTLADGEALAPTSFRLEWTPAAGEQPARGELNALRIDLAPLARLAEYLPFSAELRTRLAELAPRGSLREVAFSWRGELPRASDYRARLRFEDLGMRAWRSVPGFAGMSGRLEAQSGQGRVELLSRDAGVDLPKIFPQPRIALDALSGQIEWQFPGPETLRVRLSSLAFGNADLAGTAFGTYVLGKDGPGEIDLSAELTHADGRRTASNLPLATIMGENTRAWLERAIVAGRASNVRFHLKGDLRRFPFTEPGAGQFLVAAKISDGVIDYAEGWPKIEAIDGELRFDRERLEVSGQSARILGVRLANVRVAIPSLLAPSTDLLIEGDARGPTNEFLRFIESSPVRRMTRGFTVGMRAEGDGQLQLRLKLPLADLGQSSVSGSFGFSTRRLLVSSELPPLEDVAAQVAFSESGLRLQAFRGRMLGGAFTVSGGTVTDGGLRLVAQGEATVDALRPLVTHPWLARVRGTARYDAELSASNKEASLRVRSDLKGVDSTLPAPLAKRAEEAAPLDLRVLPHEGVNWRRVSASLGGIARAEVLRAPAADEDAKADAAQPTPADAPRDARARVQLSPPADAAPLALPTREGLTLSGTLGALDLDAWRAASGGAPGGGQSKIDLEVGVLDLFGKRLRQVEVRAGSDVGGWSADVVASELEGNLAYRSEGDGLLVARLKRFRIPEDAPGVGAEMARGEVRRALPTVDLIAERFEVSGRDLGRAEIGARPVPGAWEIDKLVVLNPHGELNGKGTRKFVESGVRTSLAFSLRVSDVGKFLTRVGYPHMVDGGRARVDGSLAWRGEPQRIDYPSLEGDLKLSVEDGQFLEMEPGLGKLVGLISLQALPKRITLDFRDVFSDGFKFDRISSSIATRRGVMSTEDFEMRGPSAEIGMRGRTDLAAETQALRVKIVPSVSDTASAAVAILNPAIGAAALLAQRALKNPLGQMLAFEYEITGSWSDPQVKKLGVQPQPGGGAFVEKP